MDIGYLTGKPLELADSPLLLTQLASVIGVLTRGGFFVFVFVFFFFFFLLLWTGGGGGGGGVGVGGGCGCGCGRG